MKSTKGSALLVAILLSAILLAALAGLLTVALNEYRGSQKSYFDTAAFNLAESGIDRAASCIAANTIASAVTTIPTGVTAEAGVWYKKMNGATVAYYRGYFPNVDLGNNRKGTCSVILKPGVVSGTTTTYSVYALGIVAGGTGTVSQRALHVELASSSSPSSGGGAAVAAQTTLKFGSGVNENPFDVPNRLGCLIVASYDSKINNGRADMTIDRRTGVVTGDNFGDSAMVGLKSTSGTATLQSGIIYGSVAVGGGLGSLEVVSNPKNNTSTTEWPSHNPYACSVIDLAAAAAYRTSNTAETANWGSMGYNIDPSGTGGLGDNVSYNYKFNDSIFSLDGIFNKDPSTNLYTTPITTDRTELPAYDGATPATVDPVTKIATYSNALASSNTNATKTVLGPNNYTANSGVKTVTRLSNVTKLGEIVVKGDAMLVISGTANCDTTDKAIKLSFADSTSKLTIVYTDDANFMFENANNNVSSNDNFEPTTNTNGTAYSPDRVMFTSSGKGKLKINTGTAGDAAAILKAPNGEITIVCQSTEKLNQFRGQLIADSIELNGSTYLGIFYDINLGGGGTTKQKIALASWKQILPSDFAAQL